MSKIYSAHPALALEQLQSAELEKNAATHNTTTIPHRRHHFSNKIVITTSSTHDFLNAELQQKTLPDRTISNYAVFDEYDNPDHLTKDCINCAATIDDEPDELQKRFSSTTTITDRQLTSEQLDELNCQNLNQLHENLPRDMDDSGGCLSGFSSMISSPSASTVSTPLSTPTRLTPHHQVHKHNEHCCQKSAFAVKSSGDTTMPTLNSTSTPTSLTTTGQSQVEKREREEKEVQIRNHQFHYYHHHAKSSAKSGCKKLKKFDPRLGPSPYRQLLPIALCILSFAVVFSLLIIYMDTTASQKVVLSNIFHLLR